MYICTYTVRIMEKVTFCGFPCNQLTIRDQGIVVGSTAISVSGNLLTGNVLIQCSSQKLVEERGGGGVNEYLMLIHTQHLKPCTFDFQCFQVHLGLLVPFEHVFSKIITGLRYPRS